MTTVQERIRTREGDAVDRLTDQSLVARLRAGDGEAFARVVDEWSPVMLHVARRYVADRQAAEDVVQDTWLGVITGLPRFEGRSALRSWAFSILINRAKTRRSRDARVVASTALAEADDPARPTVDPARFQGADGEWPGHWSSTGGARTWQKPENSALYQELVAVIDDALDELPERQRLVVQMRDVAGMTPAEICGALAISPQNERVLLHRGRAALRTALETYHAD